MRVLIVGCGYVGLPLGTELARQGHEVFGLRRSDQARDELKAAGIELLKADVGQRESLERLPAPFDWVVNLVSAGAGGAEVYREVYLQGTTNLLNWLQPKPPRKFVYTSSTSVYGQSDGANVKEDAVVAPVSETARILLATEQLLAQSVQEQRFPAVVLRVAGIYGPERGYWFRQFLAGEARIEGNGSRLLNMIHRDDLVGVILASLQSGRPGEIYNAVDDEPVTQLNFFHWLAEALGRDLPPSEPEPTNPERKRGWSNKKVINRKLKAEIGYQFKYPTFRQGYTAEIRRLMEVGQLT